MFYLLLLSAAVNGFNAAFLSHPPRLSAVDGLLFCTTYLQGTLQAVVI